MSNSIKNGKIVKEESKYAKIREAARKGAAFNYVVDPDSFPYISDERIDSLTTRLSKYGFPGFTEGVLILLYATAPEGVREDDDKLLELAVFYANLKMALNDTEGLLEDRKLMLYF